MTISKKILLAATLGLGMQCGVSAYDKVKVIQVLNFASRLEQLEQQQDHAQSIAQWLRDIIKKEMTALNYNDNYISFNLLTVTQVINTISPLEAKLAGLIKLKTENDTEENAERQQFVQQVAIGVATFAVVIFLGKVGECLGDYVGKSLVREFFTA